METATKELFEKLIEKQEHSFENVKRLCTNYKKDSSDRKTMDYLMSRLEALEAHWQEFQMNHEVLMTYETKGVMYFEQNTYQRLKTLYEEIRHDILSRRLEIIANQKPPTSSPEEQADPEAISVEHKKLLRQQMFNFRAFERISSKINVSEITEKWELQDSLVTLKNKWDAIDKIHWELDFELKGEEWNGYRDEFSKHEMTFDKLKKRLNQKISNSVHYDHSTPRLEIPPFMGNFDQWVSFRDLFTETIHNNPLLTKSQKMQHLKTKLKGEAEKLVQHLSISAENYESAWSIIEHRYENKRLLFSSYMNTLLHLPTIQIPAAHNIKKLHDTLLECINGLNNLGLEISTWDPILVHLMLLKLDSTTYADYIHDLQNPRELPNLSEFINFLETKFMAYEAMKQNNPLSRSMPQTQKNQHNFNEQKSTNFKKPDKWTKSYSTTVRTCPLCNNDHVLMHCKTFLNMTLSNRNDTVSKLKLCNNCLFSHGEQNCTSTRKCKVCGNAHHTLLHDDLHNNQQQISTRGSQPMTSRASNHINSDDHEVLLTTVQLKVENNEGSNIILRALLDQGSQVTLITENAAQRLRLPRRKMNAVVSGVGTALGNCKGHVTLKCKSIHSDYTFETGALIMNKLINNLPNSTLNINEWDYLRNLKLADPDFNVPGPIDILLGADIYSEIIEDGVLRRDQNCPVAQNTKLGYILSGNVIKTFNCFVTLNDLDSLSKFWETEEISSTQNYTTNSENFCETLFTESTERKSTGEYVVKMPLKSDIEENLGKSRPQAIAQFLRLERKMSKNTNLAQLYKQFIDEYISLGHMKPANKSTNKQLESFLPHHDVLREDALTTKLRVVFNASMPTSTKYSLNDLMEKGPNLQKEILVLMITWRTYKYALTADIEKMFRAIYLHEDQQHLQKIFWRSSSHDPIQEWQLCTVTYGMKCAPFLAMRTLQQLAEDEGHAHPLADKALRNQFYMDDVITGHSTVEGAKALQNDLYRLLKKGGFTLRKWASNDPATLQQLTEEQKSQDHILKFSQDESTKTLGIGWNTKQDVFCFNSVLHEYNNNAKYTKRLMLSEISKIYDPLGWLAPATIKVKLLFQEVWSENIQWDEPVPERIAKEWERIRTDLPAIKNISIPRWIQTMTSHTIEIHGFCDASQKAYAGVVYSRTVDYDGHYVINLLAAKTKVSPLKQKTTLPRLELCGALLLAKLIGKVKTALVDHHLQIYCWTDSQVVLAWLQGTNTKWERYVTCRTNQINNIVPAKHWRQVKTKENSADCATRGLFPSQLVNYTLWWEGPQWLKTWKLDEITEEKFTTDSCKLLECFVVKTTNNSGGDTIQQIIERFSKLTSVIRCTAWVLRFVSSLRNKTRSADAYLTLNELHNATTLLIKHVQQEYFYDDIESIKKTGLVSSKSKIANLTPYLDNEGILRVGGRLQHSALPETAKHPSILPHSGYFTKLVIEHAHKQTLHGGARLTLGQTRDEYWIIGGNRAVKAVIRSCVRCHKFKPTITQQIMGNAPAMRVCPSRAFSHVGTDFTGFVNVKLNRGRGVKTNKGYIAIFICLVTKAVHIELVSDLSSDAFIAALKRLCARRGTPKHIYSDNGTNFKGASKILHEEFTQYETMTSPEFFNSINELRIEWHFLCPRWPTAAGIWEAAVKSMKHHLRRVMGDHKLDFEQLTTLLAQIEACMNSRPLCPLTEDPEDLEYLTPGHFLTGSPTMSLPQESQSDRHLDLRNRWKIVEAMHQHIWNRWSKEYLHQLQTKSKWLRPKPNLEKGDLVLVKEDSIPPGKWAMGRIIDLHPGKDGYVRVVSLKTQGSTLKRPITKLCPLPKNEYNNITEADVTQSNNDSSSCDAINSPTEPVSRSRRRRRHNADLAVSLQ